MPNSSIFYMPHTHDSIKYFKGKKSASICTDSYITGDLNNSDVSSPRLDVAYNEGSLSIRGVCCHRNCHQRLFWGWSLERLQGKRNNELWFAIAQRCDHDFHILLLKSCIDQTRQRLRNFLWRWQERRNASKHIPREIRSKDYRTQQNESCLYWIISLILW